METPNSLLSKSWPGITNALFVPCAKDPWLEKDLFKMKIRSFVRNAHGKRCWKKWRPKVKRLINSQLSNIIIVNRPIM